MTVHFFAALLLAIISHYRSTETAYLVFGSGCRGSRECSAPRHPSFARNCTRKYIILVKCSHAMCPRLPIRGVNNLGCRVCAFHQNYIFLSVRFSCKADVSGGRCAPRRLPPPISACIASHLRTTHTEYSPTICVLLMPFIL